MFKLQIITDQCMKMNAYDPLDETAKFSAGGHQAFREDVLISSGFDGTHEEWLEEFNLLRRQCIQAA